MEYFLWVQVVVDATFLWMLCTTMPPCLGLLENDKSKHVIVFVWSKYDGGNIEQKTIGYGCRQNQEAKLKIVGGVVP